MDLERVECGPMDSVLVNCGTVDLDTVECGPVDSDFGNCRAVDLATVESRPMDSGLVKSGPVDLTAARGWTGKKLLRDLEGTPEWITGLDLGVGFFLHNLLKFGGRVGRNTAKKTHWVSRGHV